LRSFAIVILSGAESAPATRRETAYLDSNALTLPQAVS
jgi:hypothetical protein